VIAVMLRWRHWIPLFLLAGFGATTFGAFLIAVNGTLFGIHTNWSWYAWLAVIVEVVAVVVGVVAAAQEHYLSQVTDRIRARRA
jgi:heme exporter protein D